MISAASRVRPHPDVMFKVFDFEAVLLNLRSGLYYGINEVSTRFWELAGEHQRMGNIYQTLLDEFDVAPEQLWDDLVRLVEGLRAEGLVEIDDVQDG